MFGYFSGIVARPWPRRGKLLFVVCACGVGGGRGRRANNNWAWDDNLRRTGKDTAVSGGSMAGAGYALSQQRGKAAVGTSIVMIGAGVSMTGVIMLGVGIIGGIVNSWFGH